MIRPGNFLHANRRINGGGIAIKDYVLVDSGVHFYTNNLEFCEKNKPIFQPEYPIASPENRILVRKVSGFGAKSIILSGVEIAKNSNVRAGLLVTRNVPPKIDVAGNLGRISKEL